MQIAKSQDKKLMILAVVIIAVALLAAAVVWQERLKSEAAYKDVQIVVNMDDIATLANSQNISIEEMSDLLKERGVSVVLFKERSIADLERMGKLDVQVGKNILSTTYAEQLPAELSLKDTEIYVAVLDKAWEEQVWTNIEQKVEACQYYQGEVSVIAIPGMIASSAAELSTMTNEIGEIGLGWENADIEQMADLGFGIMPQVRTWDNASDQSLRFVTDEIKNMPSLYAILFNDKEIIGYKDTKSVRTVADLLRDENGESIAPIASIEFNDQAGLNTLGILLNKNVVRLHTISNSEMSKFETATGLDEAMDRWMLAARERNMRALLVRFFNIDSPAVSFDKNMNYLETLQTALSDSGFTLGGTTYTKPQAVGTSQIAVLIVGVGVAAGFMLMLLLLRFRKLAVLGFVLALVCWGGVYWLNPILARKLMALASVIIFPIVASLVMLKPQCSSLAVSIGRVVIMSLISFIGAVFMVGLISDTSFMLKLDSFVGVKIAHIIPIMAVPFALYIWNTEDPIQAARDILGKAVTYKWAILAGVLAICGYIYISRTGNTTAELSTAESTMRTALNDWLGVRPRSKEFLIGYPFLLLLLYLGASKQNWVLTLPAVIGQVSLVNTYAHIHTPLLISLQRSFNGLALGLVLGIVLVIAVKFFFIWWRKYQHE